MEEKYICKFCGKECKNPNSLRNHERLCKENPNHQESYFKTHKITRVYNSSWNKGLSKETDERVLKISKSINDGLKSGKIKPSYLGKHLSNEHKKSISNGMKKAHKGGRAHNIGESRWNSEHSYPEKWFIKVLQNELNMFENLDYFTEMPFGKYALDFAWPDKKLCIEIDGEQHERFEEYKLRDEKKDKLLIERGWTIFRIKWKECFNNPKFYIEKVKSFFK